MRLSPVSKIAEVESITDCPFCAIVIGQAQADVRYESGEVMAIVPLNPVADGHLLVIPKLHVADFTVSYHLTRITAGVAAHLGRQYENCNLITSRGAAATQSVFHLHWHLIPRAVDDGLALPWYSGRGGKGARH